MESAVLRSFLWWKVSGRWTLSLSHWAQSRSERLYVSVSLWRGSCSDSADETERQGLPTTGQTQIAGRSENRSPGVSCRTLDRSVLNSRGFPMRSNGAHSRPDRWCRYQRSRYENNGAMICPALILCGRPRRSVIVLSGSIPRAVKIVAPRSAGYQPRVAGYAA